MIAIGLTDEQRSGVIKILNTTLADEFIIYVQTLNAHWNVVGIDFSSMHAFFQTLYEKSLERVDDVAERVRSMGGISYATMHDYLQHTRLAEQGSLLQVSTESIKILLASHEALIRSLRKDLDDCITKFSDTGTNNFLTELLEKHEKIAWMLRAHLQHT